MFYVNLAANSDQSGSYTQQYGGTFSRLLTDDDKRLFNLNDSDRVKQAVKDIWGYKPDDIYFNDPTAWDDASYAWWSWPQVMLNLQPISVVITNEQPVNGTTIVTTLPNSSDQDIIATFHNSFDVSNTTSSSWSQTSSVTVSEEIGIEIGFFGSKTSVSYQNTWEKSGSKSFQQTLGTSTDLPIPIPAHKSVNVSQFNLISTADAVITYQVSLTGLLFANYGKTVQLNGWDAKHHFYGLPIDQIVSNLGKSSSVNTVQTVHLSATAWTVTTVSDPFSASESRPVDQVSNQVLAADLGGALCADRKLPQGTLWVDRG